MSGISNKPRAKSGRRKRVNKSGKPQVWSRYKQGARRKAAMGAGQGTQHQAWSQHKPKKRHRSGRRHEGSTWQGSGGQYEPGPQQKPKGETGELNAHEFSSIKVRVSPKSAKGGIVGFMDDGYLKVRILAAPEGGRANIELLRLLGHELKIPIRNLSIVRGSGSTNKILRVEGLGEEEVRRRLSR